MNHYLKCLTLVTLALAISLLPSFPLAQAQTTQNHKDTSPVNASSNEEIKQIAQQQNATLVQYSIISDEFTQDGKKQTQETELYIWVIKPTGEIAFRQVDLKPLWQKEKISLSNLITKIRQSIGAYSAAHSDTVKYSIADCKGTALPCPYEDISLGQKTLYSTGLKGKIEVIPNKETHSIKQLHQLQQLLIAPIADLLPTQPNAHVIFIPQGNLFLVPFAALPDAQGKYLIEQHTIATAPSIQVLNLLYRRQQKIKGVAKDMLIVGNPTMPSISWKPGEPPQKLPQIPGAELEAKQIAAIFHTQALTGDAATETAVVQKMPQARIIHLATSGGFNDLPGMEIPGAMVLAPSSQDDGLLTSEEILKLHLNAELVVLSAGDTALGKITADGVIGLSRSFFAAGVPSVVGSLWSVSDSSTAFLMTEFYKKLSENPDKAAALRHAMLVTMKKYPNPFDWAAFSLIGAS